MKTLGKMKIKKTKGFSLLELLVVLVIIGILSTQVVYMFTSATSTVKGVAFKLRSDINYARSEAVKRNANVTVGFVLDTDMDGDGDTEDGYRIFDATGVTLKDIAFHDDVQFYDTTAAGGPAATGDGVLFTGGNTFVMQANGSPSLQGTIYLYSPKTNPAEMRVPPFRIDVQTSGQIKLRKWYEGTWQ